MYKGTIVEESLVDNRILNEFQIFDIRITKEDKPENRWHIYNVYVSKNDITLLSKNIKQKWYMHFWQGKEVIAVFSDKIFEFNYNNRDTWKDAVNYGLSIGIPEEQLDFPID